MFGPSWMLLLKESFSTRRIYSGRRARALLPLACAGFYMLADLAPSSETSRGSRTDLLRHDPCRTSPFTASVGAIDKK
jgi:hypothetical protein